MAQFRLVLFVKDNFVPKLSVLVVKAVPKRLAVGAELPDNSKELPPDPNNDNVITLELEAWAKWEPPNRLEILDIEFLTIAIHIQISGFSQASDT